MTFSMFIVTCIINYILCGAVLSIITGKNFWYESLFLVIVLRTTGLLLEYIIGCELLALLISTMLTAILYNKVFLPITYSKKADQNGSDTINK